MSVPGGNGGNGGDGGANVADAFKNRAAVVLTFVILSVYVVMVIVLWRRAGSADIKWTRWVFLLSGIEAIAFAAVGWIFGKEVHRAQAATAASAQQNAQQAAAALGEAHGKGTALADAIRAHGADSLPGVEGASTGTPPLLDLANTLFPAQ